MILLTIGTQLPFDRLIQYVDEIAPDLPMAVVGQIGESAYRPRNYEFHRSVAPQQFDEMFRNASVIVSHAGIGTILTAQKYGKPIVLFARQAAFGEHRNDHQAATCTQLEGRPGIEIARELRDIPNLLTSGRLTPATDSQLAEKRANFTNNLRQAIEAMS